MKTEPKFAVKQAVCGVIAGGPFVVVGRKFLDREFAGANDGEWVYDLRDLRDGKPRGRAFRLLESCLAVSA